MGDDGRAEQEPQGIRLNGLLGMTEEVRLYSKPPSVAIDVIAPQHQGIHVELEAWARWCRERYEPNTCDSIEGNYDSGGGGRETKNANINLPENPMHRNIDRTVRHMRMQMNQHGEAIVFYYVGVLVRARYTPCCPDEICRRIFIHRKDFGTFMFNCRAAVINLLRRLGA